MRSEEWAFIAIFAGVLLLAMIALSGAFYFNYKEKELMANKGYVQQQRIGTSGIIWVMPK